MEILVLVLSGICATLAIFFFAGKGKKILRAFDKKMKESNRTEEDERRYQRVIGIFLIVLAGCTAAMALIDLGTIFILICLIGIVLDAVFVSSYIKKNFPDDDNTFYY